MDLSSVHRALIVTGGGTWSLIVLRGALITVSFLSAVSCEVTGFPAIETCEDFPLSIFLHGSPGVSSFPTTSYALFISVSSWEEIFGFCYPSPSSSWGGIHGVLILLGWIVMPWFVSRRWWAWACFEPICLVLHMSVQFLLFDSGMPPVLIVLWFWASHDVCIHGIG
jgi:hypothetical protein